MKVAIVGGGVVGLCSAYALKRAGADVVLLERGELGRGASEGNTGWISPTISTPLAAPGVLRSGLRSAFDPRGALVIRPGSTPPGCAGCGPSARPARARATAAA